MRYLSICSGIEAATVAWHPLGWTAAGFAEIEPFPSAVLAHHYPEIRNHGDFTQIQAGDVGPVDALVGGTPCQSFSVAGKRLGLDDPRGNLALEFLALATRVRPRWIVWENVPGVLSANGGRDFGTFLWHLGQCGYGWAYRCLDAQFFGVAQRRRRVFIVGHLGGWTGPATVLFEPTGGGRNHPPRRVPRQGTAPTLAARTRGGGGLGTDFDLDGGLIAGTVSSKWAKGTGRPAGDECYNLAVGRPLLGQHGFADRPDTHTLLPVGVTLHGSDGTKSTATYTDTAAALRARDPGRRDNSTTTAVHDAVGVRRLTPTECERLQGFPDGYTLIPWRGGMATDSPRYKAIGNSMAVPVMRWIGERIQLVDPLVRP